MSSSIFAAVEMAPRDPILGLNEAFNADTRPTKVNLGVGVYYDDNGKIPLLAAVKASGTTLSAVAINDYKIDIPKLVFYELAAEQQVSIEATLNPKK